MAYAVIQTGGKQYRVSEGDELEVEKLDVDPGAAGCRPGQRGRSDQST